MLHCLQIMIDLDIFKIALYLMQDMDIDFDLIKSQWLEPSIGCVWDMPQQNYTDNLLLLIVGTFLQSCCITTLQR